MGYIDMDKYFQVVNDNNIIQIDDTFKNYILTRKTSVVVRPTTNQECYIGELYKGTLKLLPGEITAAVVPKTNNRCSFSVSLVDKTLSINMNVQHFWYEKLKEFEFDVYVFGDGLLKSRELAGLEVYNSQGEPVFSSKYKYMRVLKSRFGALSFKIGDHRHSSITANGKRFETLYFSNKARVLGVTPCVTPWFFWDWEPQGHFLGLIGYEYLGDTIYISTFPYVRSYVKDIDGPAMPLDTVITYPCNYMVIDVTDY